MTPCRSILALPLSASQAMAYTSLKLNNVMRPSLTTFQVLDNNYSYYDSLDDCLPPACGLSDGFLLGNRRSNFPLICVSEVTNGCYPAVMLFLPLGSGRKA